MSLSHWADLVGDVQKKQEVFKEHNMTATPRLNAPLISDLKKMLIDIISIDIWIEICR